MQDLNDKITGNTLTAAEWNEVPSEIQNVIEALGITLSGADLNQLGKAIAGYVANGSFYIDSGAADAYVLATIGTKQAPPEYTDGMAVEFIAGNTNTAASTVNVAGLGAKSISGSGAAGTIEAGSLIQLRYSSGAGTFSIISVAVALYKGIAAGTADTITSVLSPTLTALTDGVIAFVRASGANTVTTPTFNPDSLGGRTITKKGNQPLVAGDIFGADHVLILQRNVANDTWELLNPAKTDAASIDNLSLSPVVQIVNTQTGAVATGVGAIPVDNSIPQNTEGDEYMSLAITPKKIGNILKVDVVINLGATISDPIITAALFRDSIANALTAHIISNSQMDNSSGTLSFSYFLTLASISTTTFKVRAGDGTAGTITFNGAAGVGDFGGAGLSSITITEYLQ